MRVAVWGSYNHGNFGDDVMALLFAESIKRFGGEPVVYRLDSQLARRYKVKTVNSLDCLIEGASFGIIGGGMMLGEGSLLRCFARPYARAFERDFHALLATCRKYRCSIYPLSVGGDGSGRLSKLPYWRRRFFESEVCKTLTVRLAEDVQLMASLGKEAKYFPDVLLGLSELWPLLERQQTDGMKHIGINLLGRTGRRLRALIEKAASNHPDIVFHFIKSHLPHSSHTYELLGNEELENVRNHFYSDPKDTVHFLASLDALVSSKLHLGVTALSWGVPFFSFGGKGKTQAFLRSIGATCAYFKSGQEEELLKRVVRQVSGEDGRNIVTPRSLHLLRLESLQHFDSLSRIIDSHSS